MPLSRKLTTIRVPMYEIGTRAMQLLLGIIDKGEETRRESILLSCDLVIRDSVAYVSSA